MLWLVTANRGISAWTYTYDIMNQLTQERLVVDGRTYTTQHGYYADGRASSTLTPANQLVEFLPDGHGRPQNARVGWSYAWGATYHPSGQLEWLAYANTLRYSASFNSRQQMTDMTIDRTGYTALDYSYNYDANGRVTNITDHAVSGQNRAFTYDGLGRLSTASGPWGAGSYTYDLLNNIRSKTLGANTVEIQYNANNQISRARDTRDGNIWRNYIHDARGNVTSNNRIGFSYDRSDQPVTMWGIASGSYAYDAHNRRVKQVINGETIYSVYSLDGTLRYRDNVTTGEATDYVRLGSSGPVVVRVGFVGGTITSRDYMLQDHLGSSSARVDSSGTVTWRESYTPFGETLNNPAGNADNPGFTGHIRDTATGLTYAQARYYDPAIGRFLSNDPVGFASGGPGYFNRYAYSANDPINLVDRTGECFAPPFIGTCTGFLIGGASEIVKQARNGDIQRPEAGWLSMDALSAIRSEADWRAVGSASFEGAAWGTLGGAIGAQAGRAISNGAELTGLKKYGVQIASAGLANISVQVGKGFIGLWGRVAEGAIETQVTEVEAVEVPIDEFPPLRVEVDCGRLDPDGTEGGNC